MTDKRIEPSSKLYLRLANQQDLPLLRDMRKECGWGVEKLEKQFGSDDWSFCIFLKEIGGETHEVGMGGWCLDNPRDQGLASRLDRTVYLTSLFIRHQYQRTGLGAEAMTLLEEAAVEIHGARILTLDTYCHPLVRGSDGKHEHPSTELSATVIWYRKRGYVEFREPAFIYPDNPKILGTCLRMSAAQHRSDQL